MELDSHLIKRAKLDSSILTDNMSMFGGGSMLVDDESGCQLSILKQKWEKLQLMLNSNSPYGNETGKLANGIYCPCPQLFDELTNKKILVVGAGGLGCEILKDLALSGFKEVHVIDLDTIDVSNLNRQFLFRQKDIGRPKSHVAAEFIMKRVTTCKVIPYHGKIQDYDVDFYRKFDIIISGLDNIEARRWLNSLLIGLVDVDDDGDIDPSTIIPFIDGGTEGLKGQARVIIPKITSCFECSLESFPPQQSFPMCTIAETPRIPEHCIAYAFIVEWERVFPTKKLNKDSPEDMQWVYERALQRSQLYGIEGVTYFKTLGVVKNIIPAVASTNAIISAACVAEAFKLLSFSSQSMNNYFMYMGSQGLYTHTFDYEKKNSCIVCSDKADLRTMTINSNITLAQFIDLLKADVTLQLKKPSLIGESTTLYMQNPPSLELALRSNLEKKVGELLTDGEIISVTDPMLWEVSLSIRVDFCGK